MAKPLTRLIRYLCNKAGYDFLRLQKTDLSDEAMSGLGRGGGFDAFEAIMPREVRSFDIFLRSCSQVEVQLQERSRFNGQPKAEILRRCVNSLVRSINHAVDSGVAARISLTVLDDHSSPDVVADMNAMLDRANCATAFVTLEGTGIRASLTENYERARDTANDLIYFVEDDYLHDETAILEIIESFARLAATMDGDVVLFPFDNPKRYRRIDPTIVMLGSHRHWRRVDATTGTHVITAAVLRKYWDLFMGLTGYGSSPEITEATTINKIYAEIPCFSPLPCLAVHFQHFDTLSPYFDWQKWWEASAIGEANDPSAPDGDQAKAAGQVGAPALDRP